jgi:photosystem II stability/assembly factor-like uncharacterized protein
VHRFLLALAVAGGLLLAGCSEDKSVSPTVPILQLSTRNLAFEAQAGGSNPAKAKVLVRNAGGGLLSYQASSLADWISVEYSSFNRDSVPASIPDTIRIFPITRLVTSGMHVDSVVVFSNDPDVANSPQYIRVSFNVSKAIQLTPQSFIFSAISTGNNPDRRYFKLESVGGGSFEYALTHSAPWLSLTAENGMLPDSIGIDVDISSLTSGVYYDTIVVVSPDTTVDTARLPVTLTISSWILSNTNIPVQSDLEGLTIREDGTLWTVGFVGNVAGFLGVMYKSEDMGATWQSVLTRANSTFGDVAFGSTKKGCLVGDSALVMLTSDSGKSWSLVGNMPIDSSRALWTLKYATPDTLWAVGTKGTIIRSIDGGTSWTLQNSGTSLSLAAIAIIDPNTAWVVGNNGNVFETTNAGATWLDANVQTNEDLWSVAFADPDNGWIVGNDGIMFRTVDGGLTWDLWESGTHQKLLDIVFADPLHAWVVGIQGTVVHSSDGGTTWLPQFTSVSSELTAAVFYNSSDGFIAGNSGVILKTISGGF